MTLGVDRTFPETLCQMEQTGRWRTRIPEFVRSGGALSRHQALGDRERTQSRPNHGAKDSDKERNANKKTVTMAPVSRSMTSTGQYIARRPLVSSERHTSILKNPLSHELTAQVKFSNLCHIFGICAMLTYSLYKLYRFWTIWNIPLIYIHNLCIFACNNYSSLCNR